MRAIESNQTIEAGKIARCECQRARVAEYAFRRSDANGRGGALFEVEVVGVLVKAASTAKTDVNVVSRRQFGKETAVRLGRMRARATREGQSEEGWNRTFYLFHGTSKGLQQSRDRDAISRREGLLLNLRILEQLIFVEEEIRV